MLAKNSPSRQTLRAEGYTKFIAMQEKLSSWNYFFLKPFMLQMWSALARKKVAKLPFG
jgi:hypothetical protein